MGDEVIKPGVSVFVEGDVQATGVVLAIVEGRRVNRSGPVQVGVVRVKLDGTGDELDVDAADIRQIL